MNSIHKTAIIGENVKIGEGNTILPYTIIEGPVVIGNNNTIGPHCVIGCEATDTKKITPVGNEPKVIIGDNNIIREFCVIEQPCYEEFTIVENDVFMMQGVHISHDVHLKSKSVITNMSVLAGIVKVLDGANIAMGCSVNQYTTIGQYSIVATGAACMKNVKPFSRYIPGKPISVNTYAIKKYGFSEYTEEIQDYVLNDVPVKSNVLKDIIDEFNSWVLKYGHKTY
ncbi:hypothetical protein [Marinifilum fragile]|uniref:hypothetical protein n=1 Tax=Marinifilum fragile TaxID=570161 RepID=UPI002AA73BF0|nr:hypothetical protein [Marinifilum fragile]